MIGGQLRPLAARALASAVRRRITSGVAPSASSEEERPAARRPRSNRMVAAAFSQLEPTIEERITAAGTSVEELLAVAADKGVQRDHALKIVASLAERAAAEGPAVSAKFESDPRFTRLCRMLGHLNNSTKLAAAKHDLATLLGVPDADEAAKKAQSLTLEQTVKVMTALASKKSRTVPILQALSTNICEMQQNLSVKQASDLLYALALLNFPDESLLDKIQQGLQENLAQNKQPAPVGSALTSIGILRYRDAALLDALSEWMVAHSEQCRPQDLVSFLLTLAYTGYEPSNLDAALEVVSKRLSIMKDAPSATSWLETVWALTVLGRLQGAQAASVLNANFLEQLRASSALGPSACLKLLNIDASAGLEIKDFKGPRLEMQIHNLLTKPKRKEILVRSVLDALQNLFPSPGFLNTQIDSGMGFLVDVECHVDAKGNALALDKPAPAKTKSSRIAIMVWEYADLCRRVSEPTGPNKLAVRLLQAQGARVLQVPHSEFSPNEKLVQRVQYLEKKIKSLAKEKVAVKEKKK
ncbi:FAST kinase domain-containing protein 3, mitochondrial [Cloeon dipterum]|uniref:FAST kinase domain-containing protein 3, mitochondrial n=1 Tax=Cloeon dipterum TaxID=197152 RepID=UPI00321FDA04